MNEEKQKNILFQEGLSHYRSKDYLKRMSPGKISGQIIIWKIGNLYKA